MSGFLNSYIKDSVLLIKSKIKLNLCKVIEIQKMNLVV